MSLNREPIKTLDHAKAAWHKLLNRELPEIKKKDEKILDSQLQSKEYIYFINNVDIILSTDAKKLEQIQKLIVEGEWNDKLFIDKEFPRLIITLYFNNLITPQQAYSNLCVYQARLQFPDLKSVAVLDEKGNFTKEAINFLIPSLNDTNLFAKIKGELLESFRLLILTLPVSERYFFIGKIRAIPSPVELSQQLAVNGSFLTSNEFSFSNFIYLTAGLKDAVGIARFGLAQHVRSIPRLGVQTREDIEAGIRKDIRPSVVRINGDTSPAKIHGFKDASPLILRIHDDYHADILSSIPINCRRGIERLVDITRKNFIKKTWSLETWDWIDNENRLLMESREEFEDEKDMAVIFSSLLDKSPAYGDERGGFLINYQNNRAGELTVIGVNFIIDTLENRAEWIKLGINPEKLIDPFKHFYDSIKTHFNLIKNPDRDKMIFNCKLYLALKTIKKQQLFSFLLNLFDNNPLYEVSYSKAPKSNRILFNINKRVISSDNDLIAIVKTMISSKENAKFTEIIFNSDFSALELDNYLKYYATKKVTNEQAIYLAKPTFGNWFALNKKQNACVAATILGFFAQCFYYQCVAKEKHITKISGVVSPALFSRLNRHTPKVASITEIPSLRKKN